MKEISPQIPNFYGAVFTSSNQPFSFQMEGDSCDIVCMTLKDHKLPSLSQSVPIAVCADLQGCLKDLISHKCWFSYVLRPRVDVCFKKFEKLGEGTRIWTRTPEIWRVCWLAMNEDDQTIRVSRADNLLLTPDSPDRAIVLEQIPLHASQKRISWSYEPVTRMTERSCRPELPLLARLWVGMDCRQWEEWKCAEVIRLDLDPGAEEGHAAVQSTQKDYMYSWCMPQLTFTIKYYMIHSHEINV